MRSAGALLLVAVIRRRRAGVGAVAAASRARIFFGLQPGGEGGVGLGVAARSAGDGIVLVVGVVGLEVRCLTVTGRSGSVGAGGI